MSDRKFAIVTGGSRGIGQGVSVHLARLGFDVAVLDREPAEATCSAVRELGADAWSVQADVSDQRQVEDAFEAFTQARGAPDVLVNVAGVYFEGSVYDTAVEDWDEVMAVNARGTFLCSKSAALRMRGAHTGRIINILSTAAAQGFRNNAAYCASKGAALLFTRALATDLAADGITVNAVAPGTIQTTMGDAYLANPAIAADDLAHTPLGRFGTVADVAEAVGWLATGARWMTGAVIVVDGGFLASGSPNPQQEEAHR